MEQFVIVQYKGIYAQQRHRSGRNGMYDPSKNDKQAVERFYVESKKIHDLSSAFDEPVGVLCIFEKKYRKNKKKSDFFWDTKPDSDNLEKFVFDVAENCGILKNDSRIAVKLTLKLWGEHDRSTILFSSLSDDSKLFYGPSYVGLDQHTFSLDNRTFQSTHFLL